MCMHVAMVCILFIILPFHPIHPFSPASTVSPDLWQPPICPSASMSLAFVLFEFHISIGFTGICFLLDLFPLTIMPSRLSMLSKGKISFSLMDEYYSCVYVCVYTKIPLSIHPSMTRVSPYLDYCK